MTATRRPASVRARGARRLTQMTVGMVVVGVGSVVGLAIHDAQVAHAASGSTTKGTPATATNTSSRTTDSTAATTDDSASGSGIVTSTQSAPLATSGGS